MLEPRFGGMKARRRSASVQNAAFFGRCFNFQITNRTSELRNCFIAKERVLAGFVGCLETNINRQASKRARSFFVFCVVMIFRISNVCFALQLCGDKRGPANSKRQHSPTHRKHRAPRSIQSAKHPQHAQSQRSNAATKRARSCELHQRVRIEEKCGSGRLLLRSK